MALRLKRELGLFETTAYGVGIIIGAGIYVLLGAATGLTGNTIWLSFIIGAIISIITGLSYAELSSMFPKEAAEYVYMKRAYKNEFFAFLVGWFIIFTGIVSIATVAMGFGGYLNALTSVPTFVSALLLIVSLSFINYRGIRDSSRLNILFTGITVFGLVLIIVLGFRNIGSVNYFETSFGLSGIIAAAALVFFAYIGFEEIANVAEETKNPRKILPKALILAIVITTILYVLTSLVAVSVVDWRELGKTNAPLALVGSKTFLGENASLVISIIALFTIVSTVLGISIMVSRMIYGMSNERSLPKIFSKLHRKRKTPWIAIIAVMLISIAFLFVGNIKTVAEITSLGAFITFTNVNLALIWLRITKSNLERPFKVPLNIGKYPILPIIGVMATSFMVFQFKFDLLLIGAVVMVLGVIVHTLYRKGIIG